MNIHDALVEIGTIYVPGSSKLLEEEKNPVWLNFLAQFKVLMGSEIVSISQLEIIMPPELLTKVRLLLSHVRTTGHFSGPLNFTDARILGLVSPLHWKRWDSIRNRYCLFCENPDQTSLSCVHLDAIANDILICSECSAKKKHQEIKSPLDAIPQ
jgi:hypothetical protein